MKLETMEPNPVWDEESYADAVDVLGSGDYVFKVWGGDWCKDCRAQLPDFAAALEAAGVPEDRIEHYPVEKEDGQKVGPKVEEYGIELIPTIVVERAVRSAANGASGEAGEPRARDGQELVRYVEEEDVPAAAWLAERLQEAEATA